MDAEKTQPSIAPHRLSNRQVETFFRDGFLGPLPRFASIELLDHLADRLTRVESEKLTNPLYGRFSVRDWHLLDPELLSLFNHPGMIEPLKQLIGEDLILWRSKAFIKPPFGSDIGWHQEWGPFNGAEIGNDIPALLPTVDLDTPWNITIWFALADIDETMGPIRFIPGSHRHHFPVEQVPFPNSAFYEDPFIEVKDPLEIVRRAKDSTLILDIDTSGYFNDINLDNLTFENARQIVLSNLAQRTGEVMIPKGVNLNENLAMPMKKGEFVIFYERTLHGSDRNETDRVRPAVNCRVTMGSTLVYPQRLNGQFIDGSNLDIRNHHCIRLSGTSHHPENVYEPTMGNHLDGEL
jgi:non-heme Fe2+,alpha-ketoglutarate-dependent halogenase